MNRANLSLFQAMTYQMETRWPLERRKNNLGFIAFKSTIFDFLHLADSISCADLTRERATDLIQQYLDYRHLQGKSGCSLYNYRARLSAAFGWLIKNRMVPFEMNPASRELLNLHRVDSCCKKPLSHSEASILVLAARETSIYPAILLCLCAGLRPRGASRVKREDLDLEGRTLTVKEKNRQRIVPLSAWFVSEMKTWLEKNEWQIYHCDTTNKRMKALREANGLPKHVTMQALRRTFIATLYSNGVAPQLAANLAGNSITIIQKHYCQLETLNARSVVDVLAFS